MTMNSPPTTPIVDPDIREELLKQLDKEIMATQQRHDETQIKLHERRQATQFQPDQFDDAVQDSTFFMIHDYSFNLTGISLPQPPKWKQADYLYKDFKKFQRSCT